MNNKYTINSFFAGVGGIDLGFEQTGKFKVQYANEFNKYANITYSVNNPDVELDNNDIHSVNPKNIPDCDIIVGGFPCQAFSQNGKRKGFEDTRGTLFFEMLRMIEEKQPKVILAENVKGLISHDKGNTLKVIINSLKKLDYHVLYKVMNTKKFGNVPQNRERIYIVAFKDEKAYDGFNFPKEQPLTTTFREIVDFENKYHDKYYYGPGWVHYDTIRHEIIDQHIAYYWTRRKVKHNTDGVFPTLQAGMGTGGNNVPLILTDDNSIRKLTPKETFNVQGFPKDFKIPKNISNSRLYTQVGNSVSVPVIKRIAENIAIALEK